MTPDFETRVAALYMGDAVEAAVHDGDPGADGSTNELTSAGRQALTWSTTATPGLVESNSVSWAIPDSTVLTAISIWDGAGVCIDVIDVDLDFTAAGTYGTAIRFQAKDPGDA